jgi:cation diffusion facilitator family transporter
LAVVTGWQWCDPLIAIGVAINILWTGWNLLRRSADGLMDIALAPEQQQTVIAVLEQYRPQGMDYHALRTRQSGTHSFIEVHVLVPGEWTVQRGHDLAENLETEIRQKLPGAQVVTHLEPLEDPASHSHLSTVSSEK